METANRRKTRKPEVIMEEFRFEITGHVGVLNEGDKGWKKEVNYVSWNGREAKLDIRDWAPDHKKMGKGLTFSEEETKKLRDILVEISKTDS